MFSPSAMTRNGLGKQTEIAECPGVEQAKHEMIRDQSNENSTEKQTDGSEP
jgi:hypothetical protein